MQLTEKSKEHLLPYESWERVGVFCPQVQEEKTPQDTALSFLRQTGRFHSPLSLLEKIQLKLFASSSALDFFHIQNLLFSPSEKKYIPPEWQILLRYLYRERISALPSVQMKSVLHDTPKNFFVSIPFRPPVEDEEERKKIVKESWGNSSDFSEALSKSVGELLERYFLFGESEGERASVRELRLRRKVFLSPHILSQFSDDQKKRFTRFCYSEDDIFGWVEGMNIFTKKKLLLPSQCIFWNYPAIKKEPMLMEPNTSGGAGHFSYEEAVIAAVYEAVERDSFLLYWLNTLSPPVIDSESLTYPELCQLREKLKRNLFEVVYLNTTTDIGIPSFLCVLIDRSHQGPRVAVGGGCGWNVEKILLEITYKTLSSFQNLQFQDVYPALPHSYRPFEDKKIGHRERLLLWQNPEMFSHFEFFLQGRKQSLQEVLAGLKKFQSIKEEYADLCARFKDLGGGYEIYVYEAKHAVLKRLGYHVVKVCIPALVRLYLNEPLAPLGAKRLKDFGERYESQNPVKRNPWPHPFP